MYAAIVAFVSSVFSSVFARELILKFFLRGLILAAVPVAMLAGFNYILSYMCQYIVMSLESQNLGDLSVTNLGGLAIYLLNELGITQVIYMIMSAYGIKMVLRSVPFVKL